MKGLVEEGGIVIMYKNNQIILVYTRFHYALWNTGAGVDCRGEQPGVKL